MEYAGSGLRANVVAPGAVDTACVARSQADSGAERVAPEVDEARRRAVMASHPIGRMGTPDEIAEVIVFLASPRASFITGAVISADGGYTAI